MADLIPDPARNPIAGHLARSVRMVIFDVDGVLTDGGLWVGATASGESVELKRFDLQDSVGIKMLMWAGIKVAVVSGRVSRSTAIRMADIGVTECHQVADAHKLPIVRDLLLRTGTKWREVAMLADDLPDLAVLRRVGFPAAVSNATQPVAEIAVWQSLVAGGHGGAREFADALLRARGQLNDVIERYVRERSMG